MTLLPSVSPMEAESEGSGVAVGDGPGVVKRAWYVFWDWGRTRTGCGAFYSLMQEPL